MITLRRELATTLAILASGVLLTGAGAVAGTLLTRRGDLMAPAGALVASLVIVAAVVRGGRRWRRRAGDPLRMARTIARSAGPLPPHFRHDLVGAIESLWILDGPGVAGAAPIESHELAEAYIELVDARARAHLDVDPLPPIDRRPFLGLAVALALLGALSLDADWQGGLERLREARDDRPPPPALPLWSSLVLRLEYPRHTGRPPREVQNPSGGLRVPAGTRVAIDLVGLDAAAAMKVVLVEDAGTGSATSPRAEALAPGGDGHQRGEFVVRGPTTWSIIGANEEASAPFVIDIEADNAPEIELPPLPAIDREASEVDTVDVRFTARDDFGLASAVLAFEKSDGAAVRLDAGTPPSGAKAWSHRFAWDLSQVALEDRSTIEFWIEVRDNDPGLGIIPLADPPGKVTRSARQRLNVRDRETEHSENIAGMQEIRDAAVDHLAHRMMSDLGMGDLEVARSLVAEDASLLGLLATMVDRLSVDMLAKERDAAALSAIHRRLHAVYSDEAALHQRVPVESEAAPRAILAALSSVNDRQVRQLEDEIIRLDDLVDHQIVDRIEELVARLQASQIKLLDLLERLKAGDTSVQTAIEQLQQRIREDLGKIREAKAQLQKEVDSEFLNLDAFQALQSRLEHEDVLEQIRQGNVDGAIERARGLLDEIRQLRETVQDRLATAPSDRMTPQERSRMVLLRELSRLQDEERGLQATTQSLYQEWRKSVAERSVEPADAAAIKKEAAALRRRVESINDARLGRDARSALGEAVEALDRLEGDAGALETREAAEALHDALQRGKAGAKPGEREAGQLERALSDAARVVSRARQILPMSDEGLGEASLERLGALPDQQRSLRGRASALLEGADAEHLPDPGKAALRSAGASMERGSVRLQDHATPDALREESEALRQIQRAIDSLRSTSPPPSAAAGPSSTESERDRSLRDEVVEAMRERPPEGFSEPVQRYYEELLR